MSARLVGGNALSPDPAFSWITNYGRNVHALRSGKAFWLMHDLIPEFKPVCGLLSIDCTSVLIMKEKDTLTRSKECP